MIKSVVGEQIIFNENTKVVLHQCSYLKEGAIWIHGTFELENNILHNFWITIYNNKPIKIDISQSYKGNVSLEKTVEQPSQSKLDLDKIRILLNEKVDEELAKAIMKHGIQEDITIDRQFVIASEEFGEIANAILEDSDNLKTEIAQTMAMLVKLYWLIENKES